MKNKYKTPRFPRSEEERKKNRAHVAVMNALKDGTLIEPQHCEDCGRKCRRRLHPEDGGYPLHAHHEDYDKPLEVNWVCRPCHTRRHTVGAHSERPEVQIQRTQQG